MPLTRTVSSLLIAASLQLAGCTAALPKHLVADAPPAPFVYSGPRPRINLELRIYEGSPGLDAVPQANHSPWRATAEQAVKRSGLFSEVRNGRKEAVDGELRIGIYTHPYSYGAAFMRLLTALSLGVVPSSANVDYTVRLSLRDRNGQEVFRDSRTDGAVEWAGFALAPLSAQTPQKTGHAIIDNLLRTGLKAALDANALPPVTVSANLPALP